MTSLTLTSTQASKLKVDALVVGVAKGSDGPVLTPGAEDVDKAVKGLADAVRALGATGKAEEITRVPTGGLPAKVVVAVGLGDERPVTGRKAQPYDPDTLRRAAGAAARALAGSPKVGIALPVVDVPGVAAVADGAALGAYAFDRYRVASKGDAKRPVESVTLTTVDKALARNKDAKRAVANAGVVAEAVHLARDLVNTPPADLPPAGFVDAATKVAKGLKLKVDVLDEKALAKGGYGGILGVGQGSTNPPRLLSLTYRHSKARKHLAFVGKGITFDSGGLSLKPAKSMEGMKADMGGAAAAVAAVVAVARLGLPVNVTAWAPLAENLPSGSAQRPSDVLTIYGGRTVEVLNTDAEGRLVLADAIVRAAEESPDLIVDAATLTGAQLVALGSRTAGIMSNDDELRTSVFTLSQQAGEQMWPMPLPSELRKSMDSQVADIANIGDRNGGMLVGGLFLAEFVPEGTKWVHMDIAGPAFNEGEPYGYTPKGGTGAAVRTFVRLAQEAANGLL